MQTTQDSRIDHDYNDDDFHPSAGRNYGDHANELNENDYDYEIEIEGKSPLSENDVVSSKLESESTYLVVEEKERNNTEEALLDLEELEELHTEAERMKAVGNKHMASQEYMRAYQAYSTALQLSPVGPSSHVFLSNRAAALLSLKKYPAAATDARRAIALAPTFGKAHARLGQALYFLKDYDAAVRAYEDAIQFEPDNEITQTYLEKAKSKLQKQQQKKMRQSKDSTGSNLEESSSMAESAFFSVQNSIATDTYARFGVVQREQYLGIAANNAVMKLAAAGTTNSAVKTKEQMQQRSSHAQIGIPSSAVSVAASAITTDSEEHHQQMDPLPSNTSHYETSLLLEADPEFEEAIRIQQRANKCLVQKQYRAAIEEYTAALFLVPDDPNLSPDLHLGRAHALNGSRRHESARNDALLAIKLNPTAAAFSTLAKSLFYMKLYAEAVEAFQKCMNLLPHGESLGLFDQAYLEKAEKALAEQHSLAEGAGRVGSHHKQQQPVPKLPPPRFVTREEALQSQPPALRPMPKEWPQQLAMKAPPLKCGSEREVVFLSEALGVKLNRGCDGIVRVLSVTPVSAGSVVARQGDIQPGDIVREAAGVDIRRPITNIMWGDTVALIKMAPRPISFLIAKELSPIPPGVLEELKRRENEAQVHNVVPIRPSSASGDEPVPKDFNAQLNCVTISTSIDSSERLSAFQESENEEDIMEVMDVITHDIVEVENAFCNAVICNEFEMATQFHYDALSTATEATNQNKKIENDVIKTEEKFDSDDLEEDIVEIADSSYEKSTIVSMPTKSLMENGLVTGLVSARDEEEKIIGGEILFSRDQFLSSKYCGWDTLRWMAYSGSRKISFCQQVYRQSEGEKKRSLLPTFWRTGGKCYESRTLAVYEKPELIMVLRRPESLDEVNNLLGLPDIAYIDEQIDTLRNYWVLESAVDPSTAKLRLSTLTTVTSLAETNSDDRDRSCFSILTPVESIVLTAVHVGSDINNRRENFYKDSGAYLETLVIEASLANFISSAFLRCQQGASLQCDMAWKHQIIIGSLHSIVLSGNIKLLDDALDYARVIPRTIGVKRDIACVPASIIDAMDEGGYTPLYYAGKYKMLVAVEKLVFAGADTSMRFEPDNSTLYHIVAKNLDCRCLSIMVHSNLLDVNVLDRENRTPMYVAATVGCFLNKGIDASRLEHFIVALRSHGGCMFRMDESSKALQHPISFLASYLLPEYLPCVIDSEIFRHPLSGDNTQKSNLGALYHYPVHFALLAMRKELMERIPANESQLGSRVTRTIRALFEHGFEPNERIEWMQKKHDFMEELEKFLGFAPIQILAAIGLELETTKGKVEHVVFNRWTALIADVAEILVRNGARISLDLPPLKRQRTASSKLRPDQTRKIDVFPLRIECDKQIMALLGGEKRLNQARKYWNDLKPEESTEFVAVNDTFLDDSNHPGGSDNVSCCICWIVFGNIMNRKHRCRMTGRIVCDECSSKRLKNSDAEHRISDGQYNFVRAEKSRKVQPTISSESPFSHSRKPCTTKNFVPLSAKFDQIDAAEQSDRESLFGGLLEKAANFVLGEEDQSNKLGSLTDSLGRTRDALNQRGEKLSTLNDKSAQLVDASSEFAKMANELRKQSEGGFFW